MVLSEEIIIWVLLTITVPKRILHKKIAKTRKDFCNN